MNPLRALFLSLSRMPPAVMLLVIVGLAVVVTMMVTGKMSESESRLKQREAEIDAQSKQTASVVYASKDIPEGATISADCLEEKQVPAGQKPMNALENSSMAVGRISKGPITAGNIVTVNDLAMQNQSVGFEAKVKEGMRAVTFAVDNTTGVAGFVAPGSYVDIYSVVNSGAKTKAAPILSDVQVVAVGSTYQRTAGGTGSVPASSVTVALAPGDTAKLIKGVVAGKLYLALRNDKDHTPVAVVDVTTLFDRPSEGGALASLPPPPGGSLPPPPGMPAGDMKGGFQAPPLLHEVEQWAGSKKEVITVPKG